MEIAWPEKEVIIATKGLPYTATQDICFDISGRAKSPVFILNEILEEMYERGGYTSNRRPSTQEDEHLQSLAFSMLCKVAEIQLRLPITNFKCILVESHLSFPSQLDELIELSSKYSPNNPHKLIILNVRARHKLHWKILTTAHTSDSNPNKKWFLPGSWNELEKVIYDYDAEAWDEHYHLMSSRHPHLKMLVMDPFLDCTTIFGYDFKDRVCPFDKAIEHLLTNKEAPPVLEFRTWRKKFVEGILLSDPKSSNTNNNLCSNSAGDCVFKYHKHVAGGANCRACEQPLDGEAYTCISCGLALHNSCAEFEPANHLYPDTDLGSWMRTFDAETKLQACKSCIEEDQGFSYECGSCIFETHLKWRLVPTVVCKPRLHPHPLSIHIYPIKPHCTSTTYVCELCSFPGEMCCYYCVVCNSYYHLRCVHSPLQLEHRHGGHLHLMNLVVTSDHDNDQLVFSRDVYLDPEDFCCDLCYIDLDSLASFYRCQECPDYVARVPCASNLWKED